MKKSKLIQNCVIVFIVLFAILLYVPGISRVCSPGGFDCGWQFVSGGRGFPIFMGEYFVGDVVGDLGFRPLYFFYNLLAILILSIIIGLIITIVKNRK